MVVSIIVVGLHRVYCGAKVVLSATLGSKVGVVTAELSDLREKKHNLVGMSSLSKRGIHQYPDIPLPRPNGSSNASISKREGQVIA